MHTTPNNEAQADAPEGAELLDTATFAARYMISDLFRKAEAVIDQMQRQHVLAHKTTLERAQKAEAELKKALAEIARLKDIPAVALPG